MESQQICTCIVISHVLSPMISVRRRNKAVASAFESPVYSLRRSCDQGASHAVAALRRGKPCTILSHRACQAARPQRFTSVVSSGSFGGRMGLRVVSGLCAPVHFSRSVWHLASACRLVSSRWEEGRCAGDLSWRMKAHTSSVLRAMSCLTRYRRDFTAA
jgi:hypothetical protein